MQFPLSTPKLKVRLAIQDILAIVKIEPLFSDIDIALLFGITTAMCSPLSKSMCSFSLLSHNAHAFHVDTMKKETIVNGKNFVY